MNFVTKTFTSAALALAFGATSAAALTVNFDDQSPNSVTQTVSTGPIDGQEQVVFEWLSTPITLFANFTTDASFDLLLNAYTAFFPAGSSDVTGYTLDLLDGANGTAVTRFTNDTNFCTAAAGTVSGNCNLITGETTSGGNTGIASRPGETLLSSLAAGSYQLGLFDSASPEFGSADFRIVETAAVPLPAGFPLLLAAMGALGFAARRKRA